MRRLLPLLLLTGAGCVERSLYIRSEPPGATIYLDGDRVGTTPLELPFSWYGEREVMLELTHYGTVKEIEAIPPPWWQIFPLDFITDVLIPFPIRDRRTFEYRLEEARLEQDRERVLQRAMELKQQLPPGP
jgi:hypothetical protein